MDISALLAENILQGVILGVLLGVLLQLATKLIQLFLVVQFVLFKWLEARNIIIGDWDRLTFGLLETPEIIVGQAQDLADSLIEMGVFGSSLVLGFLIGRKLKK